MSRPLGGFLGAQEQERRDRAAAELDRRHERWDAAMRRARAAGFSERQAPFAAMAFETLRFLRHREPTVAQVRARVGAQYPWLFEVAAREKRRKREAA